MKMKAVLDEIKWYKNFFVKVVSYGNDSLYLSMLQEKLPSHFDKKKTAILVKDLKSAGLTKILWWCRKKADYDLSAKILLYALIRVIGY